MAISRRDFLGRAALAVSAAAATRTADAKEARKPVVAPSIPPMVDTHVHFWDPNHLEYGWIRGNAILNRAWLPKHYQEQTKGLPIRRMVFVQAACRRDQAMDEVIWVNKLAENEPRIQAIVADAPLEQGKGAADFVKQLAGHPRVRGVRCMLQSHKDPAFALNPAFVEGVRLLESHGLSFDFGVRADQLPACAGLAKQCPGVHFMLDHLGAPTLTGPSFDTWKRDLENLAGQPNVYCKLSGLATRASQDDWTTGDLAPAIRHALACFGFERTAFGSDWPVMLLATAYPRWVTTVLETVDSSETNLRRLFAGTGTAFYRLGDAR